MNLDCYSEHYLKYLDMKNILNRDVKAYISTVSPKIAEGLYFGKNKNRVNEQTASIEIRKILLEFLISTRPSSLYLDGYIFEFVPTDSLYYEPLIKELVKDPRFKPIINEYLYSIQPIYENYNFRTVNSMIKLHDRNANLSSDIINKEFEVWDLGLTKIRNIQCEN